MSVSALGVGGHLTALRRTRVGDFGLEQARTLDELAEQPELSYSLDEACLLAFPRRDITADEADTGQSRPGAARRPVSTVSTPRSAPDGRVMALLRR